MSAEGTTMTDALQLMVQEVAQARAALGEAKAALERTLAPVAEAHAQATAAVKQAAAVVADREAQAKALGLAHFATHEQAKPVPGLEIKLFEVLVYDPAVALAWCLEKGIAITPPALDVTAFEALAKVTPLPFVTKQQEPRAQLAKTLPTVPA